MVAIYCSVHGCWDSSESKHRFPSPHVDKKRFIEWLRRCGNKNLCSMDYSKIYNNCRVCRKHFEKTDLRSSGRLLPNALPKLLLPETIIVEGDKYDAQESSSMQAFESIPSTSAVVEPLEAESISNLNLVTPTKTVARNSILARVNVTRQNDLTPKAKYLYKKTCALRKQMANLKRNKKSFQERLRTAESFSGCMEKTLSTLDKIQQRFFLSQIEQGHKKPKGRRFSKEDKLLALALCKQSGSAYRFLSSVFTLPSQRTLTRFLDAVPVKPGFNDSIFIMLATEAKQFKNPRQKYCILMFDEMSLAPHLAYNSKKDGVTGFEDLGFRTSSDIANHAQVFMLKGIESNWKQPVYYNFVKGATKNNDIVFIIKELVRRTNEAGLRIVATVCDQGTNNVAAINSLVKDTRAGYLRRNEQFEDYYFELDGNAIILIFDCPHLLKGIRNNLLKATMKIEIDGKVHKGKWDHITTAYKIDPYFGSLRTMPKLTEAHVNPQKINKMKVSCCTQVLSHSVAVAMALMAYSGTTVEIDGEKLMLPEEARGTAKICEFFDNLYDSVNCKGFSTKPLRGTVKKNSPHFEFWKKAIKTLESIKFIEGQRTYIPPSVTNFIKNLKNFKLLFATLTKLGFKNMSLRFFNQDPLENFFAKVRQKGKRFVNPTCEAFTPFYKSLLVNNLTGRHSIGANCQDDNLEILITLEKFIDQEKNEVENIHHRPFTPVPENLLAGHSTRIIERQTLNYVMGYIMKSLLKHIKIRNCKSCRQAVLASEEEKHSSYNKFILAKEYDNVKSRLQYVNIEFSKKMNTWYSIIKLIMDRDLDKVGILQYLMSICSKRFIISNCEHNDFLTDKICHRLIKLCLHNYCRQLCNILCGKDLRKLPQNISKFFKNARELHSKTYKKKVISY